MPAGRPSEYSDEIAAEIVRRLSAGETLTRICADDHMPERTTVWRWTCGERGAPDTFGNDYARAREEQAAVYFDEVVDLSDGAAEAADAIAEEASERVSDRNAAQEYRRVYSEEIQARRLRVDSRKWVLARMNRRKYGDSSNVKLSGDSEAPIQTQNVHLEIEALPEDERKLALQLVHSALQRGAVK